MKKLILLLIIICFINGCSVPSVASREATSTPLNETYQTSSITSSAESEPALTGIDLYMKCFNEGKYDIYNLKIGDPIQNAIDEFGQGKKHYYGLGAYCYDFGEFITAFADGTETYENRVLCFDIIGKNITVFGLTTGVTTTEEVKKIFGEPEGEWCTGQYSYENYILSEEAYNEGDRYYFISYSNTNDNLLCHINFFFEYGILKVISLGTTTGFYE